MFFFFLLRFWTFWDRSVWGTIWPSDPVKTTFATISFRGRTYCCRQSWWTMFPLCTRISTSAPPRARPCSENGISRRLLTTLSQFPTSCRTSASAGPTPTATHRTRAEVNVGEPTVSGTVCFPTVSMERIFGPVSFSLQLIFRDFTWPHNNI